MSDEAKVNTPTRRRLTGVVVSANMQKTIVVETETYRKHDVYKKRVAVRKKYKVDDRDSVAKVGDTVLIEECRPISHDKRFRLVKVVKEAN